jgi:hypothetical protein
MILLEEGGLARLNRTAILQRFKDKSQASRAALKLQPLFTTETQRSSKSG